MSSLRPELQPQPVPETGSVPSFDGTLIHYDLYRRNAASLILVVPGFWRDRRHASMVRLATFLLAQGHSVAVVDVRGHGDSGGTYGFNADEHQDIAAVASHLATVVPFESLALVGLSYGWAISISTAARHPDLPVRAILLISAVADFAMITPKINPLTIHRHIALGQALKKPRFEWRMRRTEKLRAVDDVRGVHVPICLIHVKDDWLISHSHSLALYEAANEPKELHVLDVAGNYHADRIFSVASEAIEPVVVNFFARHLPAR